MSCKASLLVGVFPANAEIACYYVTFFTPLPYFLFGWRLRRTIFFAFWMVFFSPCFGYAGRPRGSVGNLETFWRWDLGSNLGAVVVVIVRFTL